MQVQRLVFVVLEHGKAITIEVASADALFNSTLALLLHDLKECPGFFWEGADNAHIKRLGMFFHSSTFPTTSCDPCTCATTVRNYSCTVEGQVIGQSSSSIFHRLICIEL